MKNSHVEIFGANMTAIRNFLGITQAALAQRAGLTPSAICQIESGEREPSLSSVIKILGALGVSLERMINLTPDAQPEKK